MFRAQSWLAPIAAAALALWLASCDDSKPSDTLRTKGTPRPPNIVLILADDLGYGELGCYGQKKIHTPELDRLAREGLRFTQYYAGGPVCAPSRCALLTGKHAGHAWIRDNKEVQPEGQEPLPTSETTLAELLRAKGYATACIGKWGLGGPGSIGEPNRHGFDHFFGFLCQRRAHDHYPRSLWSDGKRVDIEGNPGDAPGAHYAMDLFTAEAMSWIDSHREQPFFLYFTPTIPHASLQVPEEALTEYRGAFPDAPYDGTQSYIPVAEPHATYAAMVTRLDRDVGRIVARLDALGLGRDTLILFASDNGPTYDRIGGADSEFFESSAGLRGRKGSLYEGGIRAPLIARWSGTIAPGGTSDEVVAAWDLLPTLCGLAGANAPTNVDGTSLEPLLRGQMFGVKRSLYWELGSYGGQQALRFGAWKAVRQGLNKNKDAPIELYDMVNDPKERHDLAGEHAELTLHARALLEQSRTNSALFPLPAKD